MIFNIAPGTNEVIIREGAAPKALDPKAPVKMNVNGTIIFTVGIPFKAH